MGLDKMSDYIFLEKDEFIELGNKEKWQYIKSLMKLIKDYKIQAEKNCLECENNLLTSHDINIDLYFEDWRECADHCDECSKEDKTNMCELQLNLINHIANSLGNLEDKFNALTKVILNRNHEGKELIEMWKEEVEKTTLKSKEAQSMFQ